MGFSESIVACYCPFIVIPQSKGYYLTKKKFDNRMNSRRGSPKIAETCKDWKMSYVKFIKGSLDSSNIKDWWRSG